MKRGRLAPDRRVAALLFSLAAIGLIATVAVAAAPPLPRPAPDAAAARDLVALLRRGEGGRWLVTYDFTRTLADGRQLREVMREARRDDLHVLTAGTSMTVETATGSYDCTLVEVRAGCRPSGGPAGLPESEVLRVAVNADAYGVSRLPGRTIAGEDARCFRVLPTGPGVLPDIGTETVTCLSRDGIALDERIVRTTGNTDERVATALERGVTRERIRALARSFDQDAADIAR
jgi:hypothetical protein